MCSEICWRLVVLAFLAVAGCTSGPNEGPTGVVTGNVTVNGLSVPVGQVNFVSEDGSRSGAGVIEADGSYKVSSAPVGIVKVTVTAPPPPPPGTTNIMGGPTPVYVPPRYNDPKTTDITFEVQKGRQEFDIQLRGQ
jgi:hypothetical protein